MAAVMSGFCSICASVCTSSGVASAHVGSAWVKHGWNAKIIDCRQPASQPSKQSAKCFWAFFLKLPFAALCRASLSLAALPCVGSAARLLVCLFVCCFVSLFLCLSVCLFRRLISILLSLPPFACSLTAVCMYVCLLLVLPARRLQGPGARDPPAGDVVLRVLPRHVSPAEGVPHVHHRRDAPHAGALHQLRDAAALAEGISR